jgi:hypothetical protein
LLGLQLQGLKVNRETSKIVLAVVARSQNRQKGYYAYMRCLLQGHQILERLASLLGLLLQERQIDNRKAFLNVVAKAPNRQQVV